MKENPYQENRDEIDELLKQLHKDQILFAATFCLRSNTAGVKYEEEIEEILDKLSIGCAPVTDLVELEKHPQAVAREMFLEVEDMFGKISGVTGVVPKLSETPGAVEWGAMPRGGFNEEIYIGLLGYSEEALGKLKEEGVV